MEPHDRRTIRSFRTHEDVRQHVFVEQDEEASKGALQELAMLQPRLVDLKNFSNFFATQLHPNLDTGIFWGLLGLLLTVRNAQCSTGSSTKRIRTDQPLVGLTT